MSKEMPYRVQVLDDILPWGPGKHIRLSRYDGKAIRLGWDSLHRMVRKALDDSEETVVEFFPADDMVVNEVNMRHFYTVNLVLPMRPRGER